MNEKIISLSANILKFVIAIVGIILVLVVFFTMDFDNPANTGGILGSIVFSYITVGLCTLLAVGFGIYQFITKGSKAVWIGLGAFVLVLLVSYLLATSSVPVESEGIVTSSTYKLIGGGITAFYIFLAVAVGAIIYSEVSSIFKK